MVEGYSRQDWPGCREMRWIRGIVNTGCVSYSHGELPCDAPSPTPWGEEGGISPCTLCCWPSPTLPSAPGYASQMTGAGPQRAQGTVSVAALLLRVYHAQAWSPGDLGVRPRGLMKPRLLLCLCQ